MHNKLKRVCSLAVLLAMLTQMAACSNTDVSDTKETTAETKSATADNTEITEATEEDTKLCPNLPSDLKFDGEEVRIMQHPAGGGDWAEWLSRDLYAESITGEPINDAVFERNSYVEDKLDVKLNVSDVPDMAKSHSAASKRGNRRLPHFHRENKQPHRHCYGGISAQSLRCAVHGSHSAVVRRELH